MVTNVAIYCVEERVSTGFVAFPFFSFRPLNSNTMNDRIGFSKSILISIFETPLLCGICVCRIQAATPATIGTRAMDSPSRQFAMGSLLVTIEENGPNKIESFVSLSQMEMAQFLRVRQIKAIF